MWEYKRDVPPRWREVIGKTRWQISLGVCSPQDATRKARPLADEHDRLLADLETNGPVPYLRAQIVAIEAQARQDVRAAERAAFGIVEERPSTGLPPIEPPEIDTRPPPTTPIQVYGEGRGFILDLEKERPAIHAAAQKKAEPIEAKIRAEAAKRLASLPLDARQTIARAGGVVPTLDRIATEEQYLRFVEIAKGGDETEEEIAPDLPRAEKVRRKVEQEIYAEEIAEARATVTRLKAALAPTGATTALTKAKSAATAASISTVFETWLSYQKQRPETSRKWRTYCRRLTDIIGDKAVPEVTRDDIRLYVETVTKLPNAACLPPALRAGAVESLLTWAEKMQKEDPERLQLVSPVTVGKHLDFARAFFGWTEQQGICDFSPVGRIKPPKDDRISEETGRRAFTTEELSRLIAEARKTWGEKDAKTFIVLTAVYTGMRLEEICQLAPGNVAKLGDIWTVTVDRKDGRQLKNPASIRTIPLPDALVKTGFCDFASAAAGPTIFGLKKVQDRYGRSFSPHFARLSEAAGITDPRTDFHSFRHSFAEMVDQILIPQPVKNRLMGHTVDKMKYGGSFTVETMHPLINKLAGL